MRSCPKLWGARCTCWHTAEPIKHLTPLRCLSNLTQNKVATWHIGGGAENDEMDASLPEEVLLDENAQAAKYSFYMIRGFEVRLQHLGTAHTSRPWSPTCCLSQVAG